MPNDPQAGTAATNPQGGGDPTGTAGGTGAGGGNAGTAAGATQGSESGGQETPEQKVTRLERERDSAREENLKWKPKIEEANRILAAQAEAVARRPPTGSAAPRQVGQINEADLDTYQAWATGDNPELASLGKAVLYGLRTANSAAIEATTTKEILRQPEAIRAEVEKRLDAARRVGDYSVGAESIAKDVRLEIAEREAAEGRAAILKLQQQKVEPGASAAGTHMRGAPTSGGAGGNVYTQSQLADLYKTDPKRARDIERQASAKLASIVSG